MCLIIIKLLLLQNNEANIIGIGQRVFYVRHDLILVFILYVKEKIRVIVGASYYVCTFLTNCFIVLNVKIYFSKILNT